MGWELLVMDVLVCKSEVALCAAKELKGMKILRKLKAEEKVEALGEVEADEKSKLARQKVRALSDGMEGWVTPVGNQKTVYLAATGYKGGMLTNLDNKLRAAHQVRVKYEERATNFVTVAKATLDAIDTEFGEQLKK